MKIHLAWIRVTAAAAIVAGVGVHPAAAQYAPIGRSHRNPPHNRPSRRQLLTWRRARRSRILSRYTRNRRIRKHNPPRATKHRNRLQAISNRSRRIRRSPRIANPQLRIHKPDGSIPARYGANYYVAQQPPTEVMPAAAAPTGATAPDATR